MFGNVVGQNFFAAQRNEIWDVKLLAWFPVKWEGATHTCPYHIYECDVFEFTCVMKSESMTPRTSDLETGLGLWESLGTKHGRRKIGREKLHMYDALIMRYAQSMGKQFGPRFPLWTEAPGVLLSTFWLHAFWYSDCEVDKLRLKLEFLQYIQCCAQWRNNDCFLYAATDLQ